MYLALARMAFQRQLTYRAATFAGLLTNVFFGAIRAAVLVALFNARGDTQVAGYTLPAAITYTGLTQALIGYIALWGWWDVVRNIRTGDVATDLSRPLDFFAYWCAQDAGRALAQMLLRGVPMMLIYALVYPVVWPPTAWHWLALIVSLIFSWLLSFAWRFLYSLAAFWTQDAIGFGRFAIFAATFLSGFIMPLAFMPEWMITLMRLTPFPATVNTPIEIYLGITPLAALPFALIEQFTWVIMLIALARLTLAAGVKKLVIQGG